MLGQSNPWYAGILMGVEHTLRPRSWPIIALAILLALLRVSGPVHGQEVTVQGDYFVKAEVDDETPYVGQQVTFTVKFYVAHPTENIPTYKAPEYTGFLDQARPYRQEYSESVDDRVYTVYQVSTILYPMMAGDLSIGPATMTVPLESCIDWPSARNCPGAFLPLEERGGGDQFDYDTPSLELIVRALPPGWPALYSGAVGKLTIESAVNTVTTTVGDPITLSVTISGEGNIENLPSPPWPKLTDWRSFDGSASNEVGIDNGILVGSRSFELMLIPEVPGNFDLPTIEYAYFDPEAAEYVTISTDPIVVEVLPGPDALNAAASPTDLHTTSGESADDIRGIKPPPTGIRSRRGSVAVSPIFWALWVIPVAGLLALAGPRAFRRIRRGGNPIEARRQARARLIAAAPATSTLDDAASALHEYLSALLAQSSSRLPNGEIVSRVRDLGISEETADMLKRTLVALDEARFGGKGTADPAVTLNNLTEVIKRIDREVEE